MHVDVGNGKLAGAVVVTLLSVVVFGGAVVVLGADVFEVAKVLVVVTGGGVVVVRQLQALEMRWRYGLVERQRLDEDWTYGGTAGCDAAWCGFGAVGRVS